MKNVAVKTVENDEVLLCKRGLIVPPHCSSGQTWVQVHLYLYLSISLCKVHILVLVLRV